MQLNPSEISDLIKSRIQNLQAVRDGPQRRYRRGRLPTASVACMA